jgi:hypothetical protein
MRQRFIIFTRTDSGQLLRQPYDLITVFDRTYIEMRTGHTIDGPELYDGIRIYDQSHTWDVIPGADSGEAE